MAKKRASQSVIPTTETPATRKGARSRAEVTADVLAGLHRGDLATITLSEFLVVDFRQLLQNVSPQALKRGDALTSDLGVVKRMLLCGQLLLEAHGPESYDQYRAHSSDIVRGWAAYMIGTAELPLAKRLTLIKPLADDPHSGVREWAWLAIRPHVAADVEKSLKLLEPWTRHASANMRRYAIEITRPRGVWCSHIDRLKSEPELALSLLENVQADESKYVQDSCANWLNDAGKSQPDFVRRVVARWKQGKPSAATLKICKRAMRSLV